MNNFEKIIFSSPSKKHWENILPKSHKGICLSLFSLISNNSHGIGEYLDLIKLMQWCKIVGFDTIQLLPLNETGKDPSPYNAISSCALNPIHLSLKELPIPSLSNETLKKLKSLNSSKRVKYLTVQKLKNKVLEDLYKKIKADIQNDKDYQKFVKSSPWLYEYALFKVIREEQNYSTWDHWPEDMQNINLGNIEKYLEKYQEKLDFHFFVQYLCFSQLKTVKKFADKNDLLIMGDLPILMSKNSCDVWLNKSIFNLNKVAWAPPDSFSIYGQKWGFPIYNWDKIKANNFDFWKKRLNTISDLYHIYRIDHVVGFFRIWSIEKDDEAYEGRFEPRNIAKWKKNGTERLKMLLKFSKLLPIAEDLGLIPKMVYKTLDSLGICGTKIIPWQKTFFRYKKYNEYPPLSLSTLSTHDSETFKGWWESSPRGSKRFARFKKWKYSRIVSYDQMKEVLKDSVNTSSIFHINLLQEYLSLYPELINKNLIDERINIPGTLSKINWTYKFIPTIEQIIEHKKLNDDIKQILS